MFVDTPCIIGTGWLHPKGYRYVRVDGVVWREHRLALAQHLGLSREQMQGQVVRHLCENRECRNPEHLALGTESENHEDQKRGNRIYRKLNQELADEVRGASGSQRDIAVRYGISQSMVYQIKSGKQWSNK